MGIFSTRNPKDFGSGVASGLKSIARGFSNGLQMLVAAPVVGFQDSGAAGLAKGLGIGLVSAIVLPVAGISVGVAQTVRGAINTAEAIENQSNERRRWDKKTRTWTDYYYSLDSEFNEYNVRQMPDPIFSEGDMQNQRTSGNVKSKKFYDLLGVEPNATPNEITKAYYKLARQLHPDRNQDDPKAKEKFQELAAAYTILADPTTRSEYDRMGENAMENSQFRAQAEHFSVFLISLFACEQLESYVGTLKMASMLQIFGPKILEQFSADMTTINKHSEDDDDEDEDDEEEEEEEVKEKEGETTETHEPAAAATGEAADADSTVGEAATGEAATGEAATGEAATGEAATGEAATGEAATGEAATGEVSEETEVKNLKFDLPSNMEEITSYIDTKRQVTLAKKLEARTQGYMDAWEKEPCDKKKRTELIEEWIKPLKAEAGVICANGDSCIGLLYAAGFAYENAARSWLGKDSFLGIKRTRAKLARFGRKSANMIRTLYGAAKVVNAAQKLQIDNDVTKQEKSASSLESVMAAGLHVAEQANIMDVESAVAKSVKKLLSNMDVSQENRKIRAKAVKYLGKVYQKIAEAYAEISSENLPPTDDSEVRHPGSKLQERFVKAEIAATVSKLDSEARSVVEKQIWEEFQHRQKAAKSMPNAPPVVEEEDEEKEHSK